MKETGLDTTSALCLLGGTVFLLSFIVLRVCNALFKLHDRTTWFQYPRLWWTDWLFFVGASVVGWPRGAGPWLGMGRCRRRHRLPLYLTNRQRAAPRQELSVDQNSVRHSRATVGFAAGFTATPSEASGTRSRGWFRPRGVGGARVRPRSGHVSEMVVRRNTGHTRWAEKSCCWVQRIAGFKWQSTCLIGAVLGSHSPEPDPL